MPTNLIHLIGAGGHARVVADALVASGVAVDLICIRDGRAGLTIMGRSVVTPEIASDLAGAEFHVAIGDGAKRRTLHAAAIAAAARPRVIVHPAAVVAVTAAVGPGAFIAAGAVIGPEAWIGVGTLVNHNAVVDHDAVVGDFCHVAPGAILGGAVQLGTGVFVGAGAVILPGIAIGDGATVGAGAVVRKPISPGTTWVGNPARKLR